MIEKRQRVYFCALMMIGIPITVISRNVHRKSDHRLPQITAHWLNNTTEYFTVKDSHLAAYPIFSFGIDDLTDNMLPHGEIEYKNNPEKTICGSALSHLIEELLKEIYAHKSSFSHFSVLQRKNFNTKKTCGLLVLKFKDYPFVLKLFIENPKTFINRYDKGIEPICFFYMAGGANRHITGLTRIKNAALVREKINMMPQWKDLVETPRKWFWLPEKQYYIELIGKNVGYQGSYMKTTVPAVYGIVADAINIKNQITMPTKEKKRIVMSLCNDLDVFIDPHYNNFIFLPAKTPQSYKIVIVDTEHFPTIVGLKKRKKFRNHHSWYTYLGAKCFKDTYLHPKHYACYQKSTIATELSLFEPL